MAPKGHGAGPVPDENFGGAGGLGFGSAVWPPICTG